MEISPTISRNVKDNIFKDSHNYIKKGFQAKRVCKKEICDYVLGLNLDTMLVLIRDIVLSCVFINLLQYKDWSITAESYKYVIYK